MKQTMNDPINILIVDDTPQNLVAMQALLARPGLNLITAQSGAEALEALLVHDMALALIDVQMPGMDGFELAELIRGSPRTRSVPLIFLTAGAREARMSFRGYEAGAVDFLFKPLDDAALKSKVAVFVDLHAKERQLQRQLEELRQALALNELFTAVLGHDLRNPLSAIMNGADLMLAVSQEAIVKSAATRMKSSARRMAEMVEQLLDVARIRAGGIELRVRETDYEAVCRQVADEFGTKRRIDTRCGGDVHGIADPDRLSQVLSNLLGNAVQHGAPDLPVEIEVDGTADDTIRLHVRNGGAIPPELLDDIFEPFITRRATDRPNQGLGLGLYIVKKFVEAHGGTAAVTSTAAAGTTFTLTLPRHAQAGQVSAAEAIAAG